VAFDDGTERGARAAASEPGTLPAASRDDRAVGEGPFERCPGFWGGRRWVIPMTVDHLDRI
jgi:hypothetical protein